MLINKKEVNSITEPVSRLGLTKNISSPDFSSVLSPRDIL